MKKILLIILVISLNGCGYIAKQGVGFVRYQSRAVRIDKMLADEDIAVEKREFLMLVLDIREFAMDSIGLKRNKNYTTHVHVGRDYMVDVVMASKDDAFELYRWWFPIVGNVPYKGFFDKNDAEKEIRKIERRGNYDTHIGAAGAFSTLGFFNDPILSFMINYNIYDLANLIIHEQTHATVFIKNQVRLNEEIATLVGEEGGLWYVRSRFGEDSEQYKAAILSREDYRTYINLMRELYEELDVLYKSDTSREYKLSEKERIFTSFREKITISYDELFRTPRYKGLKQMKSNNAIVASGMTYNLDLPLLYELYESLERNLPATVREFVGLKKVKTDPREHIRMRIAVNSALSKWH